MFGGGQIWSSFFLHSFRAFCAKLKAQAIQDKDPPHISNWKAPLPTFIEHIYLKHFGRERLTDMRPVEEIWKASEKKKQDSKKRKQLKREAGRLAPMANPDAV